MELRELIIVGGLTFVAVIAFGASLLLSRWERRKRMLSRLQDQDLAEDSLAPAEPDTEGPGGPLARFSRMFAAGRPSETLKARLAMAGFHADSAAPIYLGAQMLLLMLGTAGGAALALTLKVSFVSQLFFIVLGMSLCLIPNVVVDMAARRRRDEIMRHLPDAVDLLEICVSSGMGLDMAWNAVSEEVRRVSMTLADEMALTNLEMHLGASRTAAMRHMVERTRVDELGSLVAVLVQSEKFGTSVGDALKVFAESMREARTQRAEEKAEKLPVKLLFPMGVCIFPALLIVTLGPAVLNLLEIFGSM